MTKKTRELKSNSQLQIDLPEQMKKGEVFIIEGYKFLYCSACGYILDSFVKTPKKTGGDDFCCGCGASLKWDVIKKKKLSKGI